MNYSCKFKSFYKPYDVIFAGEVLDLGLVDGGLGQSIVSQITLILNKFKMSKRMFHNVLAMVVSSSPAPTQVGFPKFPSYTINHRSKFKTL